MSAGSGKYWAVSLKNNLFARESLDQNCGIALSIPGFSSNPSAVVNHEQASLRLCFQSSPSQTGPVYRLPLLQAAFSILLVMPLRVCHLPDLL
jgi:hypothetical protein